MGLSKTFKLALRYLIFTEFLSVDPWIFITKHGSCLAFLVSKNMQVHKIRSPALGLIIKIFATLSNRKIGRIPIKKNAIMPL